MDDNQSSEPGTPDSRKRPSDDSDGGIQKKSHYIPDIQVEGTYHLKILIPSIAAGAIIGKGGETIAQLQKDTNARVKMSKANDFYPGTTERVCLISGNIKAILTILSFIIDKVRERPDPTAKTTGEFGNKQNVEREKQVKILVPNSTAGMIIGKGGAFIKQIKEESQAYTQISQKAKDLPLTERCITVTSNDIENCKSACEMIISKIVEDPQSGSCLNISYADVSGPVANPNPTGSPFANSPAHMNHSNNNYGGMTNSPLAAVSGLGNLLGGGVNLTLNLSSAFANGGAGNQLITGQLLEYVRSHLRGVGFTDPSIGEVCQAISTLINYGIIGLGFGLSNANIQQCQSNSTSNSLLGNSTDGFHSGNKGPFGPIGTTVASGINLGHGIVGPTSPQRHMDRSFDPFGRQSSDLPLNANSFGLGTPQRKSSANDDLSGDAAKKVEVEVGDHIVGAILGQGGKSLVEIQRISSTLIQISKKGIYAPGTRNRIVTISGTPSGISTAKYLIELRIIEEEAKRAKQSNMAEVIN